MNLRTETPAAIDTRLAEIHAEAARLRASLEALAREEARIEAEFVRRGRWTRSYLVTAGHLHTSTACSTCYPTTSFYFVPSLSGSTEAEIVEAAGERACTVCFPSAPVEIRNRPSTLSTPDEAAAAAAREEKAAKREAAAKEAIVVEGLLEYRGRAHTFKSVRALSNFVAGKASSIAAWGAGHPTASEWEDDLLLAAKALSAVTGTETGEIVAEALRKAEKRVDAERRRLGY